MDGETEANNIAEPDERVAGTTCPFCLIVEGSMDAKVVYSDDHFLGVLDINPANPGHVLLFPKFHYTSLTEMSDDLVLRMFTIAKKLCSILLETLHAKGFNIFLANGEVAGQKVPHILLHIIPRYDHDGLAFAWKPKPVSDDYMKNVADAIKSYSAPEKKKPEVFYEIDEEERIA